MDTTTTVQFNDFDSFSNRITKFYNFIVVSKKKGINAKKKKKGLKKLSSDQYVFFSFTMLFTYLFSLSSHWIPWSLLIIDTYRQHFFFVYILA